MPVPTPDEFWQSLLQTRLLTTDALAALRREHAALPPDAAGDGSVRAMAVWLVQRGAISRWQAKRLVTGDQGPFFVGDYRLLERHEREGDARLYTARHEPSGRVVAVVLLHGKRCRELDVWTSIVRRTEAAHRTTDPLASRTWSLEQHDGMRFIVCEPVSGANVADELERLGPMPPQQAGVLVWQVAKAVAELHAGGGVHGHLALDALRREPPPPGGIERHGRVRLLQFPLAGDPHTVSPVPAGADEHVVAGLGRRVAYLAPELLRPGAEPDRRSDVYALGAMLFALLSGQPPCWDGGGLTAIKTATTLGPGPLPDSVPQPLRELVASMMAREPDRRPPSAIEAANGLAEALGLAVAAIEAPVHGTSSPPSNTRRVAAAAPRRRSRWLWVAGSAVAGLILAAVAGLIALQGTGKSTRQAATPRRVVAPVPPESRGETTRREASPAEPLPAAGESAAATGDKGAVAKPAAAVPQTISADADLPWASPTTGPPPALAYLPPGSQLVLLARLGAIEADGEGRRFLRALGSEVEAAVATLVALCGGDPLAIELVQAGWQTGGTDDLLGGFAVRFAEGRAAPADEASRQEAWGTTTEEQIEGETVYQSEQFSLWIPSVAKGRVLVIATRVTVPKDTELRADTAVAAQEPFIARIIRETLPLAKDDSTALQAALPRDLETVVGMLDADRHLTLFGSPHYLLHAGHPALVGPLAMLAEPMDRLLGESLQAVALSFHFGDAAYVEMDGVATLDVPAKTLARDLARRVDALDDAVEATCTTLDPAPYGRLLVGRLPAMLRVLTSQVRSGAEGGGAVLNAYLPRNAPHNIALAAELTLAQAAGSTASKTPAAPVAAGPKGAVAKLARTMTLVFAKDNLERSIQLVAEETGVPMEILGADLQLEGITKNQSFGLDEKDKTADEILRVILAKSNPEGKLVYIVKEKDGEEWVFITTRAAVEKRGDTLPPASGSPTK